MNKKVTQEQWNAAQKWELNFWNSYVARARSVRSLGIFKTIIKNIIGKGPGDDSNFWWAKQFENYDFVPQNLKNVVEFGCGPFTNLRLILKNRKANYIFASDPLARNYIKYRGFQLSNKWKKREYLIDDHPLEEAPFASDYFDLVVCINVLDHVQDAEMCLKQLNRVVAPNGILIFGQDLTNQEDLAATAKDKEAAGDVGHPHIFDDPDELLYKFNNFEPLIKKILDRNEGRAPRWHFGTLIFAAKKISGI